MSCNIDVDVMRQLQGALSEHSYSRLVTDFCQTGRENVANMRAGFLEHDAKKICDSARFLRSSSGTIGLVTLSKTASKLEASAALYMDGKDTDFEALEDILELVVSFYEEGETFMLSTLEA